jgi:hypothetical protein
MTADANGSFGANLVIHRLPEQRRLSADTRRSRDATEPL